MKTESLEGVSNKLAGGAFKVKTESLEGVSGKLAGRGFQVKSASLEGVSSKWTYIMQTYMYLPDSMTTLGQRSILVSRFVGSTLADYVGPTSTCSLGHRRANTLG